MTQLGTPALFPESFLREVAVKHWQETAEILARLRGQAEAGGRAALATVVEIRGSAYRRPGAKLLVRDDGRMSGSVSGGCLEADVRERALAILRHGSPRVVHYETGSDDRAPFGLGLGCNGAVDLFVQAATAAFLDAARRVEAHLRGDEPFAISTVLTGDLAGHVSLRTAAGAEPGAAGDPALDRWLADAAAELLRRGETAVHEGAGVRVFTEVLRPPPHLVVFGAGDDALPLARYAGDAGFRVTLVDHRPAFLSDERFPGAARRLALRPEDGGAAAALPLGPETYALVKTHSLANDREWIRRLVASDVAYVGVLGPRTRVADILREVGAATDRRVFGPVGLDLGADGPEQVALSIVAELLAVRAGRAPAHLRERKGSIHGA